MTLQELQEQVLRLPASDRWQLVQAVLESLKPDAYLVPKQRNLSRLQGIARIPESEVNLDPLEDYTTYLIKKYQ
ncbi:MAG: hypothetical protein NW224_18835 [Leptolyngbyaceae cyanobacterium bins.302]|nr:hypothetical protein [Leptolyngbyaceae cyanobacterium bins.302]